MISPLRGVLVLAIVAAAAGCNQVIGPACTREAVPALSVDIRDAATDAPAGAGARIIASTGTYADTLDVPTTAVNGPYGLAYEQAGTYTVTVEQEGFQKWTEGAIEVTKGECHVRTVLVHARLQR